MQRYETRIEDGHIYIETDEGDVDVGTLEDVYEITEGEQFTITYDNDYASATDWLDLDEDGQLTIDVRDTLETMDFPGTFVRRVSSKSMDAGAGEMPERTEFFAESLVLVWTEKGNIDDARNPFLEEQ